MEIRVLLLDDEVAIGRAVALALRIHGIGVDACQDVDEFIRAANTRVHDALVIDWNLRKCEGTDVCLRLRRSGDTRPIALLSGKLDADHAREIAEAAGADAYIEKPAKVETLVHEIRALVHASEKRLRAAPSRTSFRCSVPSEGGDLTIELGDGRVVLSNHVVRLRRKEFALFQVLLERAGEVVSKQELTELVWGARALRTSIVETWMSRLRKALGGAGNIIETVSGGYRISVERAGETRTSSTRP